jgi:hypothetical protein
MTKAVFMLSTGRTGTGTFAHLLQQSNNVRAFHTPNPEMIKEALEVQQAWTPPSAHIGFKTKAIKDIMRGHREKIYAETNPKLYPFARELDAAFDARFFWVIRDPFEYVNSGLSRNWYTGTGGVWDQYRERPRDGWDADMTQVHKIAWHWCEINSTIEKSLSELESVRVYHFTDIRYDRSAVLDLAKWLGATDITGEVVDRIFGLRINSGRSSAPRDPKTGDHIFGKPNTMQTESHPFSREDITRVIKLHWNSRFSGRYLT